MRLGFASRLGSLGGTLALGGGALVARLAFGGQVQELERRGEPEESANGHNTKMKWLK